jgi:hypothetical protein
MQADDPSALPRLPERSASRLLESPEEGPQRQLAQIAGAVSALARKVDAIDRPPVRLAERRAALAAAREFITAGAAVAGAARIQAELSVARYLTGE